MKIKKSNITSILTDEIKTRGYVLFTIHGNSMNPTIVDSQKVIIRPKNNYVIDDVIAYFISTYEIEQIIVHRIIFVRKDYVLTKGDNNTYIDHVKVSKKCIIGYVDELENKFLRC